MLDFGKLFNIIFVAAAGALILFFLSVIIAVAVKGKRKCRAGDVLLRIFATIVFIAATAMLACSVLSMLDGSFAIAATDVGGEAIAVFVFNGDLIELPIAELFVALSTTIGSELVAGLFLFSLVALIVDCLVANKKEGKKAKAVEATVSPEHQDENIDSKVNAAENSTADEISETEEQEQAESALDNDSTTEVEESEQTEFVGIKDENDNAFDTFDDFEEEENSQSSTDSEEEDNFDIDKILNEVENQNGEEDRFESEPAEEEEEDASDEDLSWIEQGNEPELESEEETESDEEELKEEETQEYAPSDEFELDDGHSEIENDTIDSDNDSYDYYDEQIEPNRDIYIPKVRTVVRRTEVQVVKTEKKTSTRKTTVAGQKRNTAQSSTAKKSTSASTASKRSTAAKNTQSKTSSAQKRTTSDIPAEKKLPVTRRYVILNRRNAINMFGEYLKERSQAEKDKLKSSINTIIIE